MPWQGGRKRSVLKSAQNPHCQDCISSTNKDRAQIRKTKRGNPCMACSPRPDSTNWKNERSPRTGIGKQEEGFPARPIRVRVSWRWKRGGRTNLYREESELLLFATFRLSQIHSCPNRTAPNRTGRWTCLFGGCTNNGHWLKHTSYVTKSLRAHREAGKRRIPESLYCS